MGRTWVSPTGKSLALSVELGPHLTPAVIDDQWLGVVPLVAATQLSEALRSLVSDVGVKWPNDVLIGEKKVAGILGEIPEPGRVIIGMGINAWLGEEDLPTPQSTSLSAAWT